VEEPLVLRWYTRVNRTLRPSGVEAKSRHCIARLFLSHRFSCRTAFPIACCMAPPTVRLVRADRSGYRRIVAGAAECLDPDVALQGIRVSHREHGSARRKVRSYDGLMVHIFGRLAAAMILLAFNPSCAYIIMGQL